METEYEIKILNINVKEIKKRLKKVGARFIAERHQKRFTFNLNPPDRHKWMRLRDDGEKVTLAVKEITQKGIEGTKEVEVIVNDFEKTRFILKELGFKPKNYQENKRISYALGNVKIEIDFWPMLTPYLEIEGETKRAVEKTIEKLGFNKQDITDLDTVDIYKQQGIDVLNIKHLKF